MMRTTARRLRVLGNHFVQAGSIKNSVSPPQDSPYFVVTPRTSLIDETVAIRLLGLEPNQMVRLDATVVENRLKFESHAVYRASTAGVVDLETDASLAGTYTGKDPMGLFWSLQPSPGQGKGLRFTKKDVTTPISYHIKAVSQSSEKGASVVGDVVANTTIEKVYLAKGVKRIPIKEGKLKGTLFIPEGEGPFAGLVDLFGGLVSLVETRAALLASHGFVTFALAYLYQEDLAQMIFDVDLDYIQGAIHWLGGQPFVDAERLGMVGLCFGGNLSLVITALTPQVKAVVNINGTSVRPKDGVKGYNETPEETSRPIIGKTYMPQSSKVFRTHEGVVLTDMWGDNEDAEPIPVWQHGAKVLFIVSEDDKQVNPAMHHYSTTNWPPEYKHNIELHSYPGAGHLIEPPYSPHCRAVNPTRKRMASVDFIPEEYHDDLLMSGGNVEQHSHAQIDAWRRITEFLHRTLAK